MTTYAIAKDLTIQSLHAFSSPDGDELSYDISWDVLMDTHPHSIALREAMAKFGPTAYRYEVGAASAHRDWRVCLTCTNPDERQGYTAEQESIVAMAGLEIVDGISDESGDHALVG